ncbi:hypothetical protein QQP08_014358, partial [Theobroma cacao]
NVVEKLQACFLERRSIIEALINDAKYIFDLKRMSISWIDENGKRFLLKLFLSEEEITESIIIRLIELHRRESERSLK